nr:hypothetical protein [Tanacetum cinerariifolium]
MEEEMAREDQRMNEQIARDAEIAKIHAEEELKMMIDGLDRSNEMIAKHLHEKRQGSNSKLRNFDFMAIARDLKEIEEVNLKCILMANLQQASTSGTQTDNAPIYDSDGSVEVHEYDHCYNNEIFNIFTQEGQYTNLLKPIPKSHQVQQNDNNVISAVSNVEQSGGTVEQNPATVEETCAYFE